MTASSQHSIFLDETGSANLVRVNLDGRFMTPTGDEFPCQVAEMSPVEMVFVADFKPKLGVKIIAYTSELGRFEGYVEQSGPTSFAIGLTLTPAKSKKLAEQLTWFANRGVSKAAEHRQAKRIVPLLRWTMVRPESGKEFLAKINDVSTKSVKLEANPNLLHGKVRVGDHIFVGSRAAEISQVNDSGFIAMFVEPLDEREVNEFIRL